MQYFMRCLDYEESEEVSPGNGILEFNIWVWKLNMETSNNHGVVFHPTYGPDYEFTRLSLKSEGLKKLLQDKGCGTKWLKNN